MLESRAFWRAALLVVMINMAVIGIVAALASQEGPRSVEVIPHAGADGVSTRPTIRVTYRRPIDQDTLRDAIRLEPAVDGVTEIAEHGATFRPLQPLRPNTEYRLLIRGGLREVSGGAASKESVTTFRTRASRLVVLRREGSGWGLWLVDPATERAHLIVRGWGSEDRYAVPPSVTTSPDGDRVAYIMPSAESRWSLWVARPDSGERAAILADQSGASAVALAWSPRGDLIAYEQTQRVWIVSEDGAQTALVYGRGEEVGSSPSWAPDGARLAFYDERLGAVVVFGFAGTLQSIRSEVSQAVRWAPDGQTVAVIARSPDRRAQAGISLIDLRGSKQADRFWHEGNQTEQSPAWSPDGGALAYVRLESPGLGVWIDRIEGDSARPLHQDSGWSYSRPVWSPDGGSIAFTRQLLRTGPVEGAPELWIASIDGTARRLRTGGWLVGWAP